MEEREEKERIRSKRVKVFQKISGKKYTLLERE
jgi:hypothetical protein